MGLTIHYNLTTKLTDRGDVRKLIETIRQHALDLPFKEVTELKEFREEKTGHEATPDDEERWLKIQAAGSVKDGDYYYSVPPRHIIAFSTWPGEGCESANFGFCKYPAYIPRKAQKRLATKLDGWRWRSFCKTQYASNPEYGGVQHFLRCHLCVVKLLDFIKLSELVEVEVSDEGEYWEKRDLEALAKEVGEWNEFIAGFASTLREVAGMALEAPILGFANLEHLEAKGLDRLKELRNHLGNSKK